MEKKDIKLKHRITKEDEVIQTSDIKPLHLFKWLDQIAASHSCTFLIEFIKLFKQVKKKKLVKHESQN